jgi:uncharacterized hydrophobic protein (TIGR00341 family)
MVLPVKIALPKPTEEERKGEDAATAAREALYDGVEKNSRLNLNFIVLVVLSTAVAAIGLIENNVAVMIGAMVIVPLLGPNLAFGLGSALGDVSLMRKSALTTSVGILLAVALSVVIGFFWPFDVSSPEIVARTDVGLDSVALALAASRQSSVNGRYRNGDATVSKAIASHLSTFTDFIRNTLRKNTWCSFLLPEGISPSKRNRLCLASFLNSTEE